MNIIIGFLLGSVFWAGISWAGYAWDLGNSPNENLNRAEMEQNQEEMINQQRQQNETLQERKPC